MVNVEEYMAPEIALQHGHSLSADMWSFGLVSAMMLTGFLFLFCLKFYLYKKNFSFFFCTKSTGRHPFMASNREQLVRRMLTRDPKLPGL